MEAFTKLVWMDSDEAEATITWREPTVDQVKDWLRKHELNEAIHMACNQEGVEWSARQIMGERTQF